MPGNMRSTENEISSWRIIGYRLSKRGRVPGLAPGREVYDGVAPCRSGEADQAKGNLGRLVGKKPTQCPEPQNEDRAQKPVLISCTFF